MADLRCFHFSIVSRNNGLIPVLETTASLNLPSWSAVTNAVTAGSGTLNVSVPVQDTGFFRVRQAW